MNCGEITFNSTKFIIVEKQKSVKEARRFCSSSGFKLAKIKSEQKIPEIFKDCSSVPDEFIVDQVNTNENPDCFVLYNKAYKSRSYVGNLVCNSDEPYSFICSKTISPTSTTSLTTTKATEQIEQSSSWLLPTFSSILGAAVLGIVICLFKKFYKSRRNLQENIEMQPIASTSANTVSFYK